MIGQMRERIAIQSVTEANNSVGEPIKTWSTFITVWTRARFLSGRELEAAAKINEQIQVEFQVRYRTTLNEKMRVAWRSKNWNIHAILPDEDKVMARILASEVT